MKKYIYIGIGVAIVIALGFIFPPPDGFFSGDNPASGSEPIAEPTDVTSPSWSTLPTTQTEDEYFDIDKFNNSKNKGYSQILYPTGDKSAISTTNAYRLITKSKIDGYITDNNFNIDYSTEITDITLEEVNVFTLYARVKKDGIGGKDRGVVARLIVDGKVIISVVWDNKYLEKGWTTKWESVTGTFTKKQVDAAYVEIITSTNGIGTTYPILVSSLRVYAEDQHSLTDNFDSYSDGDLNGQGSWSGSANFDIQGTTVKAGAKAVQGAEVGSEYTISKTFTAAATGNQILWAYLVGDTTYPLYMYSGANQLGFIQMYGPNGNIYFCTSAGCPVIFSGFSKSTWYRLELEWKASDDTMRARAGVSDASPGTWTDFQATYNVFDTADTLLMKGNNAGYYDEIADGAAAPAVTPEDPPIIIIID